MSGELQATPNLAADVTVFDADAPNSVVNLVPPRTKAAILRVPTTLRNMSEDQLRNTLAPDATISRLRISFWEEYERATQKGISLNLTRVCAGVCTRDYWDGVILLNEKYLAWILCPPKNYETSMKELLDLGLNRLREIVELPFADPKTGRLNPGIVSQVLAAIQMLDQRVKGAIIQKVAIKQQTESRTTHTHRMASGTGGKSQLGAGDEPARLAPLLADDELAGLEALEARLAQAQRNIVALGAENGGAGTGDHLDFEPRAQDCPNVNADPVDRGEVLEGELELDPGQDELTEGSV